MDSLLRQQKTAQVMARTREVFRDCALENGAIVAVNSDKSYVPRTASDYRAVWPRDASYICAAAEFLNMPIQEPFFQWLFERPQDLAREHLLYQKYSTHGRKLGGQFQADQAGSVLWAVYEHFKNIPKECSRFKELITWLADGLCRVWNKTYFSLHVTDLWEEEYRHTSTTMENNFTYTLAACARGLLGAHELIPNPVWKENALQMISEINEAWSEKNGFFLRNQGKVSDHNIDASVLGLVWPFFVIEPNDPRMVSTARKIEECLVEKGGAHRYQFDYFDGEGSASEGGGAWPLLNLWLAIYFAQTNNHDKALAYFDWVLERLEPYHDYIPEQIFNDFRVGVYPLAWAHAMFVFAASELKLL